tara:strand:+ start:572 stop:1138 length:567 start_codon:yes stop_codon:yes gene_type:complete
MDLPLKKVNDEIFIASDEIVCLDSRAVRLVRECAIKNSRGRARICMHKKSTDTLHEMLIGMKADSYIRPHRHKDKIESFHLVEGAADIVILKDNGEVLNVIELSCDKHFYYRLDTPQYHTLLINSPVLVIHEVTNGPFDPAESDFASFSPLEADHMAIEYIAKLRLSVQMWKQESVKVANRNLKPNML